MARGQRHGFMKDVTPGSLFMDSNNPWGLPKNFDWLAEEAYVKPKKENTYSRMGTTTIPTSAIITRPPTSAPTVKQSRWNRWKSYFQT